jgi:hypothetical protein
MRQRCVVRQLAAQLCRSGERREPPAKNTYGHKIDGLDDVGAVTTAPRPLTRAEDPPGADKPGLSPAEVQHFKEWGYVIKRGLLRPERLAPFVEQAWAHLAPSVVSRADAGSWQNAGD